MRKRASHKHGGSAPIPPGFTAMNASPYQFSAPPTQTFRKRLAAHTVQAPQSALELHPCIALPSAAAGINLAHKTHRTFHVLIKADILTC
jgi:hypothetical protein